jgi:RHS repeat-associated protein
VDNLLEWRDRDGSSDYIPLVDHRNSVVGAWDMMAGSLTEVADYTAQGRLALRDELEQTTCAEEGNAGTLCNSPGGMPFAFNSRWRSPRTGLVNMRARWYSPKLGQFTSHDPLGYVDTQNLYAFAAFDPINAWDPYGLEAIGQAEESAASDESAHANWLLLLMNQEIQSGYTDPIAATRAEYQQRAKKNRSRLQSDQLDPNTRLMKEDAEDEAIKRRRNLEKAQRNKLNTPRHKVLNELAEKRNSNVYGDPLGYRDRQHAEASRKAKNLRRMAQPNGRPKPADYVRSSGKTNPLVNGAARALPYASVGIGLIGAFGAVLEVMDGTVSIGTVSFGVDPSMMPSGTTIRFDDGSTGIVVDGEVYQSEGRVIGERHEYDDGGT